MTPVHLIGVNAALMCRPGSATRKTGFQHSSKGAWGPNSRWDRASARMLSRSVGASRRLKQQVFLHG